MPIPRNSLNHFEWHSIQLNIVQNKISLNAFRISKFLAKIRFSWNSSKLWHSAVKIIDSIAEKRLKFVSLCHYRFSLQSSRLASIQRHNTTEVMNIYFIPSRILRHCFNSCSWTHRQLCSDDIERLSRTFMWKYSEFFNSIAE